MNLESSMRIDDKFIHSIKFNSLNHYQNEQEEQEEQQSCDTPRS